MHNQTIHFYELKCKYTHSVSHTCTHLLGSGALIRQPTRLPHQWYTSITCWKQAERMKGPTYTYTHTHTVTNWEVEGDRWRNNSSHFFADEHQPLLTFNRLVQHFYHPFLLVFYRHDGADTILASRGSTWYCSISATAPPPPPTP